MFDHKQKNSKLIFLVFGLISLGIIVSVGVLLFFLLSGNSSDNNQQEDVISKDQQIIENTEVIAQPALNSSEEVQQSYAVSVAELLDNIANREKVDLDDLLSSVEDTLLSLRVPSSLQEAHLNTVLSVVTLRANLAAGATDPNTEVKLFELLQTLNAQ